MRAIPYTVVVAVVACLLLVARPAAPAGAQADPIEAELDAFWAEVSRTVAESDFEGMEAIYHPDAIFLGFDSDAPDTHHVMTIADYLEPFRDSGDEEQTSGVEFHFATRVHDERSAHEVGLFHYWVEAAGQERFDHYGTAEAYLVKKDGRWLVLVEIQRAPSTEEAWNALRAGRTENDGVPRPSFEGATRAPAGPVEAELDAFWAEVSRTVAEGDHEAMVATYHPDAVHVGRLPDDATAYRINLLAGSPTRERAAAATAEVRAGLRAPGVEFRFATRVNDENTAHEMGLYHFWSTRPGEDRVDAYGVVDSYLVKKDGRWMILVQIQRFGAIEAEWDRLAVR
ncbi:MAG: hypothetical protein R3344_10470 [Acidobacteriota bacterium]|nr:hypothetical protein [Acidobacteriota bacterium]